MRNLHWTGENIPNQENRIVVITGATSGLGKQATKVLAGKNARVIMAVRNIEKAKAVVSEIQKDFPKAKIDIRQLDLNSLKSVQDFAEAFTSEYQQLDILINNAGVMMCPYATTKDGFEIQMGTNHLGHFALTGRLMPTLLNTKNSRVVSTSSMAHKQGNINFDDLNWESRDYNAVKAYSDSKIANLYFTSELVRKYKGHENAPIFTSAHPGWTKTELDRHSGIVAFIGNFTAQKVEMGTLPSLRAATDLDAKSGDYFGPKSLFEARGYPVIVQPNKMAQNETNAKRLWDISEQLTGVKY
jgi:NAD(P)-dependent dehydrogenase (short-subunit alcohol dehydrogenase family)